MSAGNDITTLSAWGSGILWDTFEPLLMSHHYGTMQMGRTYIVCNVMQMENGLTRLPFEYLNPHSLAPMNRTLRKNITFWIDRRYTEQNHHISPEPLIIRQRDHPIDMFHCRDGMDVNAVLFVLPHNNEKNQQHFSGKNIFPIKVVWEPQMKFHGDQLRGIILKGWGNQTEN